MSLPPRRVRLREPRFESPAALLHPCNWTGNLLVFLGSLVFTLLYERTRRLWLREVPHGFLNAGFRFGA